MPCHLTQTFVCNPLGQVWPDTEEVGVDKATDL